ncbi:hypothetical protein TSUD_393360 [Trifolium subterraneum]|uniref:RRM domain-containing protein n=1 Tax=Trifolium subterraneum TaxID=3900 RepID=A0A2Z6MMI3_TRISU|nr:hypothetical protein TSUD_393360 [Trifolium subterraneum]
MRGLESERGGGSRAYLGHPRRYSFSPDKRLSRGGRDPSREPQMGGDRGDWHEVRNRRRKAPREVDDDWNRQREISRRRRYGRTRSPSRQPRSFSVQHRYQQHRYQDQYLMDRRQIRQYAEGNREQQTSFNEFLRSQSTLAAPVTLIHDNLPRTHEQNQSYVQAAKSNRVDVSKPRTQNQLRYDQEPLVVDESRKLLNSGVSVPTSALQQQNSVCNSRGGSEFMRYVSFYITNFPPLISLFYLRKGFEVCGILEDVYVPRKRNVHGEVFGFVKFSKVKDVNKLSKALNTVCFGNYRVHARVASFDRKDTLEARRSRPAKDNNKAAEGERISVEQPKEGEAVLAGVRVDEGLVCKGNQLEKIGSVGAQDKGASVNTGSLVKPSMKGNMMDARVYVRKYKTAVEDVQWAQKGVVASVINGEAISVVYNRIVDAGFQELTIIPMGADKVFVKSTTEADVMAILEGAKDFFKLLFSNWARWNKEVVPSQRGAWVRLYGIPLHAWNENFFKLCVFDCRYLRADSGSVERDRLDYARILIATSALEIVTKEEKLLVEGELIEVKIIEEWGLALGEDACLFEDEAEPDSYHSDNEVMQGDPDASNNVDALVAKIVQHMDAEVVEDESTAVINLSEVLVGACETREKEQEDMPTLVVGTTEANPEKDKDKPHHGKTLREKPSMVTKVQPAKRTRSCPPGALCSGVSGPWSLNWLQEHDHGNAGVLFSTHKKERNMVRLGPVLGKKMDPEYNKRKGGGLFRHSEGLVLIGLAARNVQVMQGNEQLAADDVWGIGNAIGVKIHSGNSNRFSALTRSRKGKKSPAVAAQGSRASGGLLTMWDSSEVEVWSSISREHVLWCHGRFVKTGRLQSLFGERVCLCGDFNAVRSTEERRSSREGPRSSDHLLFNRFIDDTSLVDLPLSGRRFTWYKGDGLSMSRLDRFLLSEEWCLSWPNCEQVAQLRGLSDHCPLILMSNVEDWGHRPVRMLKCWRDIPGYHQFVRDKWNALQIDGWGGYVLKEKFKMIKLALKEWHGAHSQNLPSRIDSLKGRLSVLEGKGEVEGLSDVELEELRGISSDIYSLSRLNASISWQQCRSLWLKEGDANTKYFHSTLASRRRGNAISCINANGITLEGVQPIRQAVFSHFASHFKASTMDRPGVENLLFRQLTPSEGGSLVKPFSLEEVKIAVWDCDSYKSPGPDGVNFGFIKDFWPELQVDIMRFMVEFHRNGRLSKGINSTFIALIPKVDNPHRLNDFRPISLVGSLYKILAKVLANRLRTVIGRVISESQTAFVKDRQILDGILIANEAVDEARKSKKELLLFKVDFEKAYDSVDWGYLDAVMGRMSFPVLWRKWIKECVCTATASVLVNGSPTDEFPLERGLRQGDPLSPLLFLVAAEGLHVLMQAMEPKVGPMFVRCGLLLCCLRRCRV